MRVRMSRMSARTTSTSRSPVRTMRFTIAKLRFWTGVSLRIDESNSDTWSRVSESLLNILLIFGPRTPAAGFLQPNSERNE